MDKLVFSLNEIGRAARQFLTAAGQCRVFAFHAEMGVGKTTFIKEVCRLLGVNSEVNSPTFAIINEYHSEQGPVYHFDLYRLKQVSEAFDIGCEDYFYSGCYCFVEWPELIEGMLPEDCCHVHIRELPDGRRELSLATD
ncbi:MAG: tRNA (adenosine(37)-N6)-threonylcarbamoyltransferase complex ATPase subunit type 1 TsaE [Bacteroidales bacterium]|nr:tRNA (adenosine(37)-N6)-threonylcarbamoyltransferase complex ATPase subunit type 1 TsaE [Bacteroidales bacterium]